MPGKKLHTDLDGLSERLQDGIETCRSVIANYRALLSDEQLVGGGPVAGDVTDGEQPFVEPDQTSDSPASNQP